MIQSNLDLDTLVINKHWFPIDTITVKEALRDAISEKVKIVCPESFMTFNIEDWIEQEIPPNAPVIQSVHFPIRAPRVIVNQYDKIPKKILVFSRRNLWRRDGFCCQYCGEFPPLDEITIDHVLPKSQGGQSSFENCVLACIACNKKKANKTPEQAGMRLRKTVRNKDGSTSIVYYHRPKKPRWNPLFALKKRKIPEDWGKFLQHMISELYWNSELEP